ncbi:MAG: ribonuclease HII [Candidatus Paceibacterota bacterium]|jgi:ribonuclease HII|nr:ribonuclease HII [Candidatus Paceibacterota bacterium]
MVYDKAMQEKMSNNFYLIGIDEAGRGPLAGPVAVGAVCVAIDDEDFKIFSHGVRDSKLLSAKQREEWFQKILLQTQKGKFSFSAAFSSADMIDTEGLTNAIRHALASALSKLKCKPEDTLILLDGGLRAPKRYPNQITIIRGDDIQPIISFASIAAKVLRDKKMIALAKKYPEYGFERHKGYGTREHYEMIAKHGILEGIHRKSFLGIVE